MNDLWFSQFREKLEKHYAWPALYTFKFIVPKGKEQAIKMMLPNHAATERQSKNGKYTSVTFQMMAHSSDAVIAVYQEASKIEGIIAL